MAGAGGRVGYEHHYGLSVDNEVVSRHGYALDPPNKTYFLEIKASFVIQRIDGGGDDIIIMDSETYGTSFLFGSSDSDAWLLDMILTCRLREYWMTAEEVDRFNLEVFAFARQAAANPSRSSNPLVPILANVEVRTVQQEGEPIESVMERAIRAGDLMPLDVFHLWIRGPTIRNVFLKFDLVMSVKKLARIRVEDRNQGLAMMETCRLCNRAPATGAQISVIPACRHAFHSCCIVKWFLMEDKNRCPVCNSLAYRRNVGTFITPP